MGPFTQDASCIYRNYVNAVVYDLGVYMIKRPFRLRIVIGSLS